MSAGKGDARRPSAVPDAVFAERWRQVFARLVRDMEEPDDACVHSPAAWRSCERCADAHGDAENDRERDG